jgi:hypothetical protein
VTQRDQQDSRNSWGPEGDPPSLDTMVESGADDRAQPIAKTMPRQITKLMGLGWQSLRKALPTQGRFHSRTVPSELPLASVCPSGLNATE